MMLLAAIAAAKFGCLMLQPTASARPEITNRSWTPPSGVPFVRLMKRASRVGPLGVMKGGIELPEPDTMSRLAIPICGLAAGLEPPIAGCA